MSPSRNTFYCTTPIYYVTARPHLGSLYSTVLADIFTRWHRMIGRESFLLTGSDEHGQKVAQAAQAAGQAPQQFVDSFIEAFQEMWRSYHIDYGRFIRTTDPDHVKSVHHWIEQLMVQGDIYKALYEGYYCTPCETFVINSASQEGDAQYSEPPCCPTCNRATAWIAEPSYFFRLSAYQDRLLELYRTRKDLIVPEERAHEVISFVEGGLRDLAISRSRSSVSWGIPFPGDASQVVYVWADALNNYISAVGYGDGARTATFARWWPAQLQILGKDIVRFHAVFWPAFLMAAGLDLPERLLVHGWIKVGDAKMSKSLGNVIDPQQLREQFGADAIRYYLARYVAVTHDAPFTLTEVTQRIDADLANDLGNLLQRITTLAHGRKLSTVVIARGGEGEAALREALARIIYQVVREVEACMLHRAYAYAWEGIALINGYIHERQPWKYRDDQGEALALVLGTAASSLAVIALLIWPVMPDRMEYLLERLGLSYETLCTLVVKDGTVGMPVMDGMRLCFKEGAPLFPRSNLRQTADGQAAPSAQGQEKQDRAVGPKGAKMELQDISIDEFTRVALVVGTIAAVDLVAKSDKLYRLTVDLGPWGIRTICSGVRSHFAVDELVQKQGIFVANLAPRMMMGIASQGMMLFAEDSAGKLQLVVPVQPVPNGTRLR